MKLTFPNLIFKGGNYFLLMPLLTITLSCCSTRNSQPKEKNKTTTKDYLFSIDAPKINDVIRIGESFDIRFTPKIKVVVDSIEIILDGSKQPAIKVSDNTFKCNPENTSCGRKNFDINIYYSDSLTESHRLVLTNLPIESPKKLEYKVIRNFYHDPEAYTQGLIYHNNFLYESTGQPNRSSIRCVDPKTGEVLRKRKLDSQFFGEGIALIGNEIYMLTYRERKGFVFNLSDFEIVREFNLQTEEGWGLTTDGKKLIQSDGTAYIYYFNPEYFTLEGQFEICNNERLVNYLNELELTSEGLYANVYGENYIVLINPENGVVTHTLDLSALFPENVSKDMDHVLNGIAYNNETKTFYVTGKQWPVMYEIKVLSN